MLAKFGSLLALAASAALASSLSMDLIGRDTADARAIFTSKSNNWCSGTQVFFPTTPNYAQLTTQRWTTYEAPTYVAYVKPSCPEDVSKVIKLCNEHNLPFLATGGGHGYSTSFGKLDNGVSLDLGNFKKIDIDTKKNTVVVGGSNVFGDLYTPLYNAGRQLGTGSCSCVGVIGGSLGGGVGAFQGLYGLISDSLISLDMITADGKRITVSAKENSDLFWGMKGAGFNYGVVLYATYKIYEPAYGNKVQIADLIFSKEQNGSFFKQLATLESKLPKELGFLNYVLYNESYSGATILADITYPGPQDKFLKLIQPFLDLKPAFQQIQKDVPWKDYLTARGFGLVTPVCQKGAQHSLYSVGARKLTWQDYSYGFTQFDKLYAEYTDLRQSSFELEFFPTQAVLAQGKDASAYPWRDIQIQLMIQMQFTGSPTGPAATAANNVAKDLRTRFIKGSGYPDLAVYISYAHGDEKPESWYGKDKLPRLLDLKKKWDPKNIFKYDNGLPV